MTITYWTGFNKRKNSTKQPTGGTNITTVVLKDDTSIMNPSFECVGLPETVNYIYVTAWGRYYFVTNVSHIGNDRLLVECETDVLATFKSNIAAVKALVEYTSSSSLKTIADPRNCATVSFEEKQSTLIDLTAADASRGKFDSVGCILLTTVGKKGLNQYVIDALDLQNLYSDIFSTDFITAWNNQYYNINECIVSIKWSPYVPKTGTLEFISVGGITLDNTELLAIGFPYTVSGYPVTQRIATFDEASYDVYYPSDDMGLGTNYLDFEPYTTGVMYLPFVGTVPIDLGVVSKSRQVRIRADVDVLTCDILYKIGNEPGDIISTYQGNFGVDVPISSQSINAMGVINGGFSLIGGLAATAAGVASENPAMIGSGLLSTAAAGVGIAQSMSVHTQTNGSISSMLGCMLGLQGYSTVMTRMPAETTLIGYQDTLGMPYFKNDTISNLSGFVKCYGASCDMPGSSAEKDTVNSYLNSGFYYE